MALLFHFKTRGLTMKHLTFQNADLEVRRINGEVYVKSTDVAEALGYANRGYASKLYNLHKDEFDSNMAEMTESVISGNCKKKALYFNRRGAWLIGMFARTQKAKAFRKWALDVLEEQVQPKQQEVALVRQPARYPEAVMYTLSKARQHSEMATQARMHLDTLQISMIAHLRWLTATEEPDEITDYWHKQKDAVISSMQAQCCMIEESLMEIQKMKRLTMV
jgi:prophage antirepressor-like protein